MSFAWLAVVSFRKFIGRPARPLPLEALQIFWIFIFSTVGGVNGLVGNFGFLLFRATTRYSIFILCIVLTFMMRRLSAATSRNQPALVAALPLLVAVAALWDQLPMVKTRDDLRLNAALSNSDRVFTVAMEKRLPDKAMVFQLPITDFPESYSGHLPSYDHFRPYLYSEHLRFSFGSDKGRPRADWQHQIGGPVRDIVTALERYGFAAVYVNRMAFKNKANDLIGDFAEAGRSEFIKSPLGDLVCVVLHPSEHPVLPPLGAAQPVK